MSAVFLTRRDLLALPLLGGLSPAQFMRRHWQKKPLLVRQAWPGVVPPLGRSGLDRAPCATRYAGRGGASGSDWLCSRPLRFSPLATLARTPARTSAWPTASL